MKGTKGKEEEEEVMMEEVRSNLFKASKAKIKVRREKQKNQKKGRCPHVQMRRLAGVAVGQLHCYREQIRSTCTRLFGIGSLFYLQFIADSNLHSSVTGGDTR